MISRWWWWTTAPPTTPPTSWPKSSDPRLRYLPKPKSNAPDTRNRCIDAAKGEWLLWLDSDDLLLPGWVARVASLIEAGTPADVYYGNLEVVDARATAAAGPAL